MKKKLVEIRNFLVYKKFDLLFSLRSKRVPVDPNSKFIVSISSYPKRIKLVPSVYESLFRQKSLPIKFLLVLTEEEWPNKEIPEKIKKLVKLGVELLWVKGNSFAVKNISPVVEAFPDDDILILDDDIIYGKHVVSDLSESKYAKEGKIVGHVAKAIFRKDKSLSMWYRFDKPADLSSQSESIFFIGYAGVYYPKHTLDTRVSDLDAIKRIVPGRGKDIWLYCATIAKGSEQVCLGSDNNKGYYIPIPLNDNTKPKEWVTGKDLDNRFFNAIDFFNIKDRLISVLPNKK